MRHTIEELIQRIDVMKSKSEQLLHNHLTAPVGADGLRRKNLLDDIRAMALGIGHDTEGGIRSEKDEKQLCTNLTRCDSIVPSINHKDKHV